MRIRVAYALKIHALRVFAAPTSTMRRFSHRRLFAVISSNRSARDRATRKPRGNRVKGQRYERTKRWDAGDAKGLMGPSVYGYFCKRSPVDRCNRAETRLVPIAAQKVCRPRAAEMIIALASRRKLTRVYRRNYMCISRHVAHGLKRPA